ncbi:hypothetical protein [Burkholderia cepacia]|uniref:hypothetical protein n=1 Tax=Burkholderia cepacia TaxID=292 RepID=UPI002FE1A790
MLIKRKEEATAESGKVLNLAPELIKRLVPGTPDWATISEVARGAQEGDLRARLVAN